MVQRRITRFKRASSKPVARCSVQRLSQTMHSRGLQRCDIDARRRRDHHVDLLDQRAARIVIHALDIFGMVAEEDRLASGVGMGAHDRMRDWRHFGFLFVGQQSFAVAAGARKVEIVHGAAAFDLRLRRRGQQIVSRIHVGEFGFAALGRHDLRIHHRRLAGALAPRTIGMPIERALVRMLAAWIAVLVEVRQHVDFRMACVSRIARSARGFALRRNCARRRPALPAADRRRGTKSAS